MTLTTPESTLLSNIKLYLAKADTELSEEGIKSLVKLTQFNTIVQRIVRVAPDSLEKVIFVALDVLQAYKERQKDEKKKRALETKEADGKDLPMIKRRKLVTPDVERGRRSTNTPAVQITGSANKASDLIKSKNSLVQNKAKTDASNNNHTLSATSHLSPEASTASTSTAPTSTAPTSTAPTSTAPTSTAPMSTAPTSSSVSSSPSEDSSIHSVISTRPSAIASISFHDTEKQPRIRASKPTRSDDFRDAEKQPQINVSHPIRSDDTRASGKPEQRTTTTVLNDPMDQAERRIHQPPLQDFSSSNTHLHPLAMENPEIAIFAEDKDIVQQLRSHFEEELYPDFSRSIKAAKSDEHISEVLGLCPMLNFDKVKHDLLTFMVQQKQDSNTWSQVVDLAEDAEPVAIFQAIKVSGANEADAKLRRIYWQIHLVKSIDRKIQEGYTPRAYDSVDSIPKAELPSFYLDDMADQMSRGLSPDARKKLERQLRSERHAGINWTKIVDNLGGMGIVFVFVFAGISRTKLATAFNSFQRACLVHLIGKLPSIQALVRYLGDNALEDFCHHGRLSDEVERKLRAAEGPEMSFVESDKEDSDDSAEDDSDGGSKKRSGFERFYYGVQRQIRQKKTRARKGNLRSAKSANIIENEDDDDEEDSEVSSSDEGDDVDRA